MRLWERFNRWLDPKFGWHILWLTPLLLLGMAYGSTIGAAIACVKASYKEGRRRARTAANPELNDLRRLAGIKEIK
jgi:hypothetical protein